MNKLPILCCWLLLANVVQAAEPAPADAAALQRKLAPYFKPPAELEKEVGPYRPWSSTVHDGGNEAQVLADVVRGLPLPVVGILGNHDWHSYRAE